MGSVVLFFNGSESFAAVEAIETDFAEIYYLCMLTHK